MASEVDICNMSLRSLNVKPISTLDNPIIQSARDCRVFYPQARDTCLRDFPWNFANTTRELTPYTVPAVYEGVWEFAYMYPSDCIKMRTLTKMGDKTAQRFKVARSHTHEKIILANTETAVLEYTLAVVNSDWFDADFVDAVSKLLTSMLAVPLTGDKGKAKEALQAYYFAIAAAKTQNAQEDNSEETQEDEWILSRRRY